MRIHEMFNVTDGRDRNFGVDFVLPLLLFLSKKHVQWNLVIKRSDITKPCYNKVILLVPALYISLFFYPDMRNLL